MNGGTEMDVRGKLEDLLARCAIEESITIEPVAESRLLDFLVNHGVTVQEWISVEDRLPDSCGFPCLLCGENSFGQIRVFEGFTGYMERGKFEWHSNQKDIDIDVWTITHWMPMPHPPKGE